MAVVDELAKWGVSRPADVVDVAASTGLELAVAAAMLMRESAGGLNIWGHDAVNTGGVYVKGTAVTRETYLRYRELGLPQQGVGPCQLTDASLQAAADRLGGCWDWRCNCSVGFGHMASLIHGYGLSDGMRRYNGSGPWAETYRVEMLQAVTLWRARLGGANTTTSAPVTPSPTPRPAAALEDDPMIPVPINVYSDNSFHGGVIAEEGSSSRYISEATLVFGVMFGSADVYIQFLGADGLGMGPASGFKGHVGQNGTVALDAPNGCKLVSVEGHVFGQGVILTAVLMAKPKP